MIKYGALLSFLTFTLFVKGQTGNVGINTQNPQRTLHIAGSNSVLRVEGLNSTYNANTNGALSKVYANASGDLVLEKSPASALLNLDAYDMIPAASSITLKTLTYGQYAESELYKTSFTLTRNALVLINYNISFHVQTTSGAVISDGKPKQIQNFMFIGSGTGIDKTKVYAYTAQSFTNGVTPTNNYITIGYYANSSSLYKVLPAGTYTVYLYGAVASGGTSNQKTSDAFQAIFGGDIDQFQISVIYQD